MNSRTLLLAEDVTVSWPGEDGSYDRILERTTLGVALTAFMILRFGYRSYFTSYQSLREH